MILFIYTSLSTFVESDLQILSQKHEVKTHRYKPGKTLRINFYSQLRLFLWCLFNIWKARIIYVWFADYHSFSPILFSKIFRKKSFLVLGGYDVANIPELNYGSFNRPFRAWLTKYSIKNANTVIPVSKYVMLQGLKRVPTANMKMIHNGVTVNSTNISPFPPKNKILTVGLINSLQRVKLKGIDFFCDLASNMPDHQFIIVGLTEDTKNQLEVLPANLTIVGAVKHTELRNFYEEAKVYCQFSMVESFCLSVVEAMSYGCIPVVSGVGALPEVVGDCGFILEKRKINEAIPIVKKAFNDIENIGTRARDRTLNNFLIKHRKDKLLKII